MGETSVEQNPQGADATDDEPEPDPGAKMLAKEGCRHRRRHQRHQREDGAGRDGIGPAQRLEHRHEVGGKQKTDDAVAQERRRSGPGQLPPGEQHRGKNQPCQQEAQGGEGGGRQGPGDQPANRIAGGDKTREQQHGAMGEKPWRHVQAEPRGA